MKILRTLDRHRESLSMFQRMVKKWRMPGYARGDKFIVICIDPPDSVNRQASWMSDFDTEDTVKILQAVVEQSR